MRRAKKSAGKSAGRPALVRQANGSALYTGGVPGNAGGTGRPPSAIRARCRESYADRIALLEQFADGQAVEKIKVNLGHLLRLVHCPKCGDALKADKGVSTLFTEVEVDVTPKARDRIAAIKELGDKGLDAGRADAEDVRARLAQTLGIIGSRPVWTSEELIIAIDPVWRAA